MRFIYFVVAVFFMTGCINNKVYKSDSATILIKTPTMKYYDKGFISKYENYTQVQIYSAGKTVLDLKLYEDKICKSTFECEDSNSFNKKYLDSSYKANFLKSLFDETKEESFFRDTKNKILIKIKRD